MLTNYKDFLKFLTSLDNKPKLLLHACCAPCSSHTLKVLAPYFDITIFYSNDNMDTNFEYLKRANEFNKFNLENYNIKFIVDKYEPNLYYEAIKGKENLGEHSIRCYKCYLERMEKTALYAKENGFDYFSTTLSISPYKNSLWLNEIGYELEKKYNVKYLYSNFKKAEGYKDSIILAKKYNLYRQDYCGCVFSKKERDAK